MVKRVITNAPAVNFRKYEEESPFIWSINNIRLPKGVKWDFTHRQWQIPFFDDRAKRTVTIKSTQMGITIINLCRALHFANYHRARIMYTLPRQDDVTDLVNSRILEMLRESPNLVGKVGDIDNVRLKKFGNSHIHFMESSVVPRMLDVDYLVNDEVDMSDQDNLDQYIARLDASEYKIQHKLSTPTMHGFGIAKEFELSDQKYWIVKCPRCNHGQVLDWDKNVRHENGQTWYVCSKCDRTLTAETIQKGEWVAKHPGRPISGYSISQMMATYISPNKLWEDYQKMATKNFVNLRLGKPYTPTSNAITRANLFKNCFQTGHDKAATGNGYYIGVDQGNELHACVLRKVEDRLEIVHLEIIPFDQGFDKIHRLIERYNARCVVIDAGPNRHSAAKVASEYRNNRVVIADYSTSTTSLYKEQKGEARVVINKVDAFDNLSDLINAGKIQFYGTRSTIDQMTTLAVDHLSNMRRNDIEQRSQLGGVSIKPTWANVGPDHFADAINYAVIASDMREKISLSVSIVGDRLNASGVSGDTTGRPASLTELMKRRRIMA